LWGKKNDRVRCELETELIERGTFIFKDIKTDVTKEFENPYKFSYEQ
jgi:hypothetical protein